MDPQAKALLEKRYIALSTIQNTILLETNNFSNYLDGLGGDGSLSSKEVMVLVRQLNSIRERFQFQDRRRGDNVSRKN